MKGKKVVKKYISTPPGVKGKGNNFYNLFTEAEKVKARAIVVIDADITSVTPEWIRNLADPIINNGQDYVNTAKLDNWSNFKQISVDEMSVMALNSRRVVNIHKPLKLGKMMNWGTLESFRE